MKSYNYITRFGLISLALLLAFASIRLAPPVVAQGGNVEIEKVGHYAGNTDVYTNKKNKCIQIKRKSTGETWKGTTDDIGRLVINTGTVVSKEDLEASEANDCPQADLQSASSATLSGVVTVAFETGKGKVNLTLPADMRAGDTISGTVVDDDSARRSDVLNGAVLDVAGKQHQLRNRVLTFAVPAGIAGAALPVILRDRSGRVLARSKIQLNQTTTAIVPSHPGGDRPIVPPHEPSPAPLNNFQPPRVGQIGHGLSIPGNFDGLAETTKVLIGNQPAQFLAESPRATFAKVPDNVPAGPTTLTVEKVLNASGKAPQAAREQFKFNPLEVKVSADKLDLRWGENTQLHVTVNGLSGLDDYKGKVQLRLKNLSPNVVRFNSIHSQELVKAIYSGSQYQPTTTNDTFTLNEQLTGINVGKFTIHAVVLCSLGCDDECQLSDPDKNRTVEVKLDFVKYHEGQVQPIYDVKVRVCCDKCMVETCWVYWTQNRWRRKCTEWKTVFQVMMVDKNTWQNIDYPTKSYGSQKDVEDDAKNQAANIPCPTGLE